MMTRTCAIHGCTHRPAFDDCDGGHGQRGKSAQCLVYPFFIGDAIRTGIARASELKKLGDVGSRNKGLPTRTAKDSHPNRAVGFQLFADGGELVVHGPGHGVAGLRAVEGDPGNA